QPGPARAAWGMACRSPMSAGLLHPVVLSLEPASPALGQCRFAPVTSRPVHNAFYEPAGPGTFLATAATAGPWTEHAQHGGPASALAARALELHERDYGQRLASVAIDILRPVPIAKVTLTTRTVRPGKRVTLIDAVMEAGGQGGLPARGWGVAEAAGRGPRRAGLPRATPPAPAAPAAGIAEAARAAGSGRAARPAGDPGRAAGAHVPRRPRGWLHVRHRMAVPGGCRIPPPRPRQSVDAREDPAPGRGRAIGDEPGPASRGLRQRRERGPRRGTIPVRQRGPYGGAAPRSGRRVAAPGRGDDHRRDRHGPCRDHAV